MIIKKTALVQEFLAEDKTRIKELLNPKNDQLEMSYSLAHARLPVGATSVPHKLDGSELYYILQGTGEMFIDEETAVLTEGELVFIPPNATQYIKNIGTVDLVFLCIVDPPWHDTTEAILDKV